MTESAQRQAVIYARVSSIKQKTVGAGLASQETRCRDFARMKNYHVVEIFTDDVSGSLTDRPGMKAMLSFVRKHRGKGTVVIIDDVSRLARNLEAHIQLRQAISSAGGSLESPSIEFGEDSDSILVENMLASVSQHQRQKNAEQTKNRMKARVQNGYCVLARPPAGFKYKRIPGRGKVLQRDEPIATVVQKALEGYASRHFETQADVMRFLQDNPLFPKDSTGIVRHQRVSSLLNQCLYAGYVEAPSWGVSRRDGQHEGLISPLTFKRIQDRLAGGSYTPRRKNLNKDFPLRGFVECDCCGKPLTGYWAKGSHSRHAYYQCFNKKCDSYGKSIRRDKIEGEFEKLLHDIQPNENVFRMARKLFQDLWDQRIEHARGQTKALKTQIAKVEKQASKLLDRIVETDVPSVVKSYETRIRKLEEEKLILADRVAENTRPKSSFEDSLRTALDFLANPWILWRSDQLEDKRTVLKLAFSDRLRYRRDDGFRTANLAFPFKALGVLDSGNLEMARRGGFEPPTPRFVVWCSIQLSYRRHGWVRRASCAGRARRGRQNAFRLPRAGALCKVWSAQRQGPDTPQAP